ESPELLQASRNRLLAGLRLTHVEAQVSKSVALRWGGTARAEDVGALTDESVSHGRTDPVTNARDKRNPAIQPEIHARQLRAGPIRRPKAFVESRNSAPSRHT